MPIDDKDGIQNRTFESLFKNAINFEIPFFQRAYSWERQQWKQLFDDIEEQILNEVVERIKNESDEKISRELLEKHLLEHEHYFGAVVVLEKRNSDPSLKIFTVIDGQQRITTVYLFLALITQILKEKSNLSENAVNYINTLEGYIKNNIEPKGDDYVKLKVYSNKGDRLPTYLKIFAGANPESRSLAIDQQLYVPGQNQIEAFWNYGYKNFKNSNVQTLFAYSQAVLKSLKIVWIPLDENKDDPQAIFEGLNDKGMPLSAVELLCSYLFKPLINEVTKQHESIHNDKWLKSIKKVGGEKQFEFYLRNLFSINKPKMIGKGRKLYSNFKNTNKNIGEKEAFAAINEIADDVDIFNQINNPQTSTYSQSKDIHTFLINIKQTGMESSIPFTLSLLKELKLGKVTEVDAIKLLKSLLNLLVRRKICGLNTTKYDVVFPNLLNKIINEPDKTKAFKDQIIKEDLYVSDQEFEDAFINKPLYKQTELEFARYVLQEIDRKMQSFGQVPDYSSINTIEHVLPQTLNDEWKTYLENEQTDIIEKIKHTIGNLCLISRPANSHEGQESFEKKKNSYTEISSLTRDIKSRTGKWDSLAIKKRSKDLSDKGLIIWTWE